jgi:hypothetical protein
MEGSGKIFGIGLSRTGTTSLAKALSMLGYNAIHARGLDHIEQYEASTDVPVAARYRQLDKRYPNSRFILTVREMESWLESCRQHYESYKPFELRNFKQATEYAFCRGVLYGIDDFDRDVFRDAYQRYVDGVHEYFKDRPQDLLELNIVGGEGFEKLAPFLGRPVPDAAFPKSNESRRSPAESDLNQVSKNSRARQIKLARMYLRLSLSHFAYFVTGRENHSTYMIYPINE